MLHLISFLGSRQHKVKVLIPYFLHWYLNQKSKMFFFFSAVLYLNCKTVVFFANASHAQYSNEGLKTTVLQCMLYLVCVLIHFMINLKMVAINQFFDHVWVYNIKIQHQYWVQVITPRKQVPKKDSIYCSFSMKRLHKTDLVKSEAGFIMHLHYTFARLQTLG